MEAGYPLESFKALTLRSMCRDLGFRGLERRDIMIDFLTIVQEEGVDQALERHSSSSAAQPTKSTSTASAPVRSPSLKRPIVSDYDTRYKNKRVKTVDTSPRKRGRPPRTSPAPAPVPSRRRPGRPRKRTSVSERPTAIAPTRSRGRPRKRPLSSQRAGPTSPRKKVRPNNDTTPRRQVFDGVLLPDMNFRSAKMKEPTPETPSIVMPGSSPADEDVVLPPIDNDGAESSLGGSNKENEMVEEMVQEEPQAPETAETSTPTRRVPGTGVLGQATRILVNEGADAHEGGDEDAEGEVDHEHENAGPTMIPPTDQTVETRVATTTLSSIPPPPSTNDTLALL